MENAPVEPEYYYHYSAKRDEAVEKLSKGDDRFQSISNRDEKGVFSHEVIVEMCHGKYLTNWRGIEFCKSPLDIIIYQSLLWEVKPGTIFELGAYKGGSALWMADIMESWKCPAHVYSVDLDLGLLDEKAKCSEHITFLQGDTNKLEEVFPLDLLEKAPHPWVVIEDVHVNTAGILSFFHKHMKSGDYWIMDDTNPDQPYHIGGGLMEMEYDSCAAAPADNRYGPEKLHIFKKFLKSHENDYRIDTKFTDMFGYNGSWNWDGYVRRM